MFLKSLEIFGFKSFADRTLIKFADGITALMGPNGCGKSNVVDAIKWVLAENRSKNLRADSMEDVIFNGTESRNSLSMAEVTLTIANENKLLPIDEDEVSIKRRIYKNGENEYFINLKQVNATAIRKLFMDTGVGKAAYSVMEQGKIDQILSAKPEDRRYLFEEAAGISRSKAEVAEAEKELERTRVNLAQIEAGLSETKRNYETLKVQADKTAKYRKLHEDKFNFELDIQLLKLKDFIDAKARSESSRKNAEEKRDAILREIDEIYSTLNENTGKINELNAKVNEIQRENIQIAAEQNGKKLLAKQLRENQMQAKEKIGQIENRINIIEEKISDYNEEADDLSADLFEKKKNLEDVKKNIDGFLQNISQSQLQITENDNQIHENSLKIQELNQKRADLQKELAAITEDIVTELDAKLKDAGYSSASNKKAKEDLGVLLEKIKIFSKGRANIFQDFASLPSHSERESAQMAGDAVKAFTDLVGMFEEVNAAVERYTKTTPTFIDDFLSPEGIITKKRIIDDAIQTNISKAEELEEKSEELRKKNAELNKKLSEYRETVAKLRENQAGMTQQIMNCEQQISSIKKNIASEENTLREQQDELFNENRRKDVIDDQLQENEEAIAELEFRGRKNAEEIGKIEDQIAECNSKVSGKQSDLEKKQDESNRFQKQLENLGIAIAKTDTEIANIKQNFKDNYSRDLAEFNERMYTITTPAEVYREKLAETKRSLAEIGSVNLMAVEQFSEEKERYERQQASFADTQKSLDNLVRVSEEIRTKSSEMFLDTYNKIRKNFHNMFRRLMNGGRAELRLTNPSNVLTSGIEIFAQPPGKKLVNISLLSGGEKTMTAVALLFATYQVRPSPFCLLDEIDAALDDKNVASFVSTLRAFGNVSQYIVITHNKKTVMGASSMLGVTMEESGITKIIQMKLDDATLNGRITFDDQSGFEEEEVEPEEGIVMPQRPPKREHNPDGTLKTDEIEVTEKDIFAENNDAD